MKFVESKFTGETFVLVLISSSTRISYPSEKAIISYDEVIEPQKTVERKIYMQVIHIIKKFVGITTITKRISDCKMSLTVQVFLASSLLVTLELTKAITVDEVLQFRVNNLKFNTMDFRNSFLRSYICSPKAQFGLENG